MEWVLRGETAPANPSANHTRFIPFPFPSSLHRPFVSFLHPDDAAPFKTALALVAFDTRARRRLRCRLKCSGGGGGEETAA